MLQFSADNRTSCCKKHNLYCYYYTDALFCELLKNFLIIHNKVYKERVSSEGWAKLSIVEYHKWVAYKVEEIQLIIDRYMTCIVT